MTKPAHLTGRRGGKKITVKMWIGHGPWRLHPFWTGLGEAIVFRTRAQARKRTAIVYPATLVYFLPAKKRSRK